MQSHSPVRLNVVGGLALLALGLLAGAVMGAAHDVAWLKEWLRRPPVRRNQVMYAHGHLGLLGLLNVAVGFTLPATSLGKRWRGAVSWAALAGGALVPLGMLLALLPEPWDRLIYFQAAGFALTMFATATTAWGARSGRGEVSEPSLRREPATPDQDSDPP